MLEIMSFLVLRNSFSMIVGRERVECATSLDKLGLLPSFPLPSVDGARRAPHPLLPLVGPARKCGAAEEGAPARAPARAPASQSRFGCT